MDDLLASVEQIFARVSQHEWAWRPLSALAIACIGVWLARRLSRVLDRLMRRFDVDQILGNFLRNLSYSLTVVVVLIAALDFAGVPTTSLLALLGAAGLAIGLALKDSLSNIASGVMLIMLRPFRAGDVVQIAGIDGIIEQVRIFQTVLRTFQNHTVILPNSQITATAIINYTAKGERRIDLPVGVGYEQNVARVREVLLKIAAQQPTVLPEPVATVAVTGLGDNSVNLVLRVWVMNEDYGATMSDLFEAVHREFAEADINIPFPQRDVRVIRSVATSRDRRPAGP